MSDTRKRPYERPVLKASDGHLTEWQEPKEGPGCRGRK